MENQILSSGAQQRISSLEIAKLADKSHKNVMRDIREMENAWFNVAGLKFELGSYLDKNGQLRPCYNLTLEQSLYVATKYNNEARAKLVLRWADLERKEQLRLAHELAMKDADAQYAREVLKSEDTLTMTMIAKEFDMSARKANKILHKEHIIFPQSGQWFLYAPLHGKNLVDYETLPDTEHGHHRTHRRMRWTEEGHRLVSHMLNEHLLKKALMKKPRYVEGLITFIF